MTAPPARPGCRPAGCCLPSADLGDGQRARGVGELQRFAKGEARRDQRHEGAAETVAGAGRIGDLDLCATTLWRSPSRTNAAAPLSPCFSTTQRDTLGEQLRGKALERLARETAPRHRPRWAGNSCRFDELDDRREIGWAADQLLADVGVEGDLHAARVQRLAQPQHFSGHHLDRQRRSRDMDERRTEGQQPFDGRLVSGEIARPPNARCCRRSRGCRRHCS